MDVERQDFSFSSIKQKFKERANDPSVSGTLILFLILDIIMLVVGSIKKGYCPADENVPVFLIVAGVVGIISKLLPFINRTLQSNLINYTLYILYIFEFIWMIVGSVWVYRLYEPDYHPFYPRYCDKTLYLFAFWLLTIRWVLLALSLICGFCYCCLSGKR